MNNDVSDYRSLFSSTNARSCKRDNTVITFCFRDAKFHFYIIQFRPRRIFPLLQLTASLAFYQLGHPQTHAVEYPIAVSVHDLNAAHFVAAPRFPSLVRAHDAVPDPSSEAHTAASAQLVEDQGALHHMPVALTEGGLAAGGGTA